MSKVIAIANQKGGVGKTTTTLSLINIVNTEPKGEIKVQKQDNYNNKLKRAEISLYAKEDIKNTAKTKTINKLFDNIS